MQHPTAADATAPIRQDWRAYTALEHQTWSRLYARRMPELERTASRVFLDGARTIGLAADRIPDLVRLNRRLRARTGWSAVPVVGFLPAPEFFGSLARRRFPTTVRIRSAESLDYTPEPDIFHDVFGHVPLHADPAFAGFLQRVGQLGATARTPEAIDRLARLFWFTIEFGLVREGGEMRIYGSGLISSIAEGRHALGPECERRPFDLDEVMATPFRIDDLQPVLYVVESFGALFRAVDRLGPRGEVLGQPAP